MPTMEKDGYEVLTDTTPATDMKIAKRRWALICADSKDTYIHDYAPSRDVEARNPGLPDDDYGSI